MDSLNRRLQDEGTSKGIFSLDVAGILAVVEDWLYDNYDDYDDFNDNNAINLFWKLRNNLN